LDSTLQKCFTFAERVVKLVETSDVASEVPITLDLPASSELNVAQPVKKSNFDYSRLSGGRQGKGYVVCQPFEFVGIFTTSVILLNGQ